MNKLKENEYRCSMCGGLFRFGWSDEKARKEAEENFGKPVDKWKDTPVLVCDNCYKKILPKKGTEPQWLCLVCNKNTYGEASTSEEKKHYCSDCYWKKESKRQQKKMRIKRLNNIERVAKIVGNKKLAIKVIKAINL